MPRRSMFRLSHARETHEGQVYALNEDNTLCLPEKKLYAVFDGVGGHNAGEVASMVAAMEVADEVRRFSTLALALYQAHRRVRREARDDPSRAGMASTAVAVRFHGPFFRLGWAGDSRAYRVDSRQGTLVQLTRDHSFVQQQVDAGILTPEEALGHPMSNLLVRSLGQEKPGFRPEMRVGWLRQGQGLLLCSDGLTDMVPDEQLRELALANHGHPGRLVDAMVDAANGAGGRDNISVIYVRRQSA